MTADEIDVDARARHKAEEAEYVGEFAGIRGGIDGLGLLLRELRGELAGIRARLDSLVAIEKQLGYQGQRLSGIEKRLSTIAEMKVAEKLAETKFQPPPGAG